MDAVQLSGKLRNVRSNAGPALSALADSILKDAELFHWFERRIRESEAGRALTLASRPPAGIREADIQVTWSRLLELAPTLVTNARA